MSTPMHFELHVNGMSENVRAFANQTLLEVLRDHLQITGPKRGCNQGVCGACTVLVDDQPMRACLLLAANLGTRTVTTIEGLSAPGQLSALQRSFIQHGAVQCGFCTSGMLIVAHALLKDMPRPSPEEVRAALSGNLCRCSGYMKIIEAVCDANRSFAA
jgi:aerobic-type carbon monoxide dehydrogenase small subunit (CoxS/CutS family)